jgi:hypothetical protein
MTQQPSNLPTFQPSKHVPVYRHAAWLVDLLIAAEELLPPKLRRDRHWLALQLILEGVPVLKQRLRPYLDYDKHEIDITRFHVEVTGLSSGEATLIALAFHLYNDHWPLPNGLTPLANLGGRHLELALFAIKLRME